jgi:hypothetical protein
MQMPILLKSGSKHLDPKIFIAVDSFIILSKLEYQNLIFPTKKVLVHLELHAESYDHLEWNGQASRKYALRWLFVPSFLAHKLMSIFLSLLLV